MEASRNAHFDLSDAQGDAGTGMTIPSTEREAASTLVSTSESAARCLLSRTQTLARFTNEMTQQ